MNRFNDFEQALGVITAMMRDNSKPMHRGTWQGVDVSKKPEMLAHELLHVCFTVPMLMRGLQLYRRDIRPNLPWADNHFDERVCGCAINPGREWENWPWGQNAKKFLNYENWGFDHNYMERYWPKLAGKLDGPTFDVEDFRNHGGNNVQLVNHGYRYAWGDLSDVVTELEKDPTTRQAILPIFFPEDTGYRPTRRKPCSISYHFILNDKNQLDIFYHLRSCDLIRHFRDDIYLTVRLLLWVLEALVKRDPKEWAGVLPGNFVMYIGNLHCFANDMIQLKRQRDAQIPVGS